jgi:Male sterility protein
VPVCLGGLQFLQRPFFNKLREIHGEGFEDFIREKLIPVEGNVDQEGLGLLPEDRAAIEAEVSFAARHSPTGCPVQTPQAVQFTPTAAANPAAALDTCSMWPAANADAGPGPKARRRLANGSAPAILPIPTGAPLPFCRSQSHGRACLCGCGTCLAWQHGAAWRCGSPVLLQVEVIVHSAADTGFDEPLDSILRTNTVGMGEVLGLASSCKNLQVEPPRPSSCTCSKGAASTTSLARSRRTSAASRGRNRCPEVAAAERRPGARGRKTPPVTWARRRPRRCCRIPLCV